MNPTKEQLKASISLLKDMVQERLNSMGPAMQSIMGPACNVALLTLESMTKDDQLEVKPE